MYTKNKYRNQLHVELVLQEFTYQILDKNLSNNKNRFYYSRLDIEEITHRINAFLIIYINYMYLFIFLTNLIIIYVYIYYKNTYI